MNADHPNDVRPILVFATHNPNKVRELQEMLGDQYQIQSLTDIGCHEEIVENALTLKGNAQIKARHVVEHYGLDCFADDTGLEVDALDGAPGVFSARYAGIHGDAEGNMTKLLAELERVGATAQEARAAQFRTVICLIQDGEEHLIEGQCKGFIEPARSGAEGFGYDPVFKPEGHSCTFAEMAPEEKNAISHRGRAVRAMVEQLLT
ncbi:MAG: RdgB/HAM1 family non-canonical purine NTP pyrophosphatase [Bacteroidota bacterium]|jgi:XTP/dITP diphosphohydrolase|nr:RdgB/HAM1 family non-canonical purine NTP pyrophosphatase [Flavobacteriales bacterium]MEC7478196.1 RdgB/HAM1 family non-canonical purine NTP pyrophosphatase [Bacteroidota bacterium]MEC8400947.1 RdgB/HAM1 family non-canonical purine NTP pyrophosphatase [Bacteroidota bacterium]HCL46839.1 non-canonical purine NTP pyrophosphatase, RdgB/HAM1 family [Flavobacteriales bacterium]